MTNLSTKLTAFFICSMITISLISSAELQWPVKGTVDIYHGFGEFRSNRYHAGLDIRTGGQPGRKIYSPVNGYLYRIKMSYNGYGKGLYIKGDDDRIYVFGHLQDFQARIDTVVKTIQIAKKRYYIDKYFPKDSIRVEIGQLLGFSGQTGAGAPHLHFETRASENQPLNPLLAGFVLNDKFAPTLKRVGFQYVDSKSIFQNGQRYLLELLSKKKNNKYTLESIPYLSRPFGFLIDGFDQSKYNGIKQAIYKVKLAVDGVDYYEVIFDSLNFETGRSVNFIYDFSEANQGRKRVRRLFKMEGNDYLGVTSYNANQGIIAFDTIQHKVTTHEAVITTEDVYGNSATARIEFLWGPKQMFTLDSTIEHTFDTTYYYFSVPINFDQLQVDSVAPFMNNRDQWGRVTNAEIFPMENGGLRLEVYGDLAKAYTLKLVTYTKRGILNDEPILGTFPTGPKKPSFSWEIVDGGISVRVSTKNIRASILYLRAFENDQLIGAFPTAELVSLQEYLYFIPASEKYKHISTLDLHYEPDKEEIGHWYKDVNFHLLGLENKEISSPDRKFKINIDKNTTYGLNFISLEEEEAGPLTANMASTIYTIKPDYFLTSKNFDIALTIDSSVRWQNLAGLCWLNEDDNEWIWLKDNDMDSSIIEAKSQGGGKFAAIIDRKKPTIKNLNIRRGALVYQNQPQIKFEIIDSLSGINNDLDISIHIDDQWLIPEYDPETGVCLSKPWVPLTVGDHELVIELTDRAGNPSRQRVKFKVKATK